MKLASQNTQLFILLTLLIAFLGISCQTLDQNQQAQEKIEARIKKFESLQEAINSQSLLTGTPPENIRVLYGEPDDVFSSGSSNGKFEIWTYEEISLKNRPTGHPIRLYFNNGKLISWEY